jgi:hypothetical protein
MRVGRTWCGAGRSGARRKFIPVIISGSAIRQMIHKQTNPDLLAKKLFDAWEARHRGGPAILYHYTAADGLLGMLQSHQIWATNVRFINDRSELDYGINLVCRVFERARMEASA